MIFTDGHKNKLVSEIRDHFETDDIEIGDIDMTYSARGDGSCIYVEFFVSGVRELADVYTSSDSDNVDWVY